jgi:regulator of PEP synthase PpsR (kinase-PPPase family)
MTELVDRKTIYIISDGTGETAVTMTKAALVQYKDVDMHLVRCKNVRTESQVEATIEQALEKKSIIIHTVVSPKLRQLIRRLAQERGLMQVDLLGPLLEQLDRHFGVSSEEGQAGILHSVDEKYFKRIEAIEYTVKHDDGKTVNDLAQADIVLVGVSRTSKTPLSIFMSHKGWRVANIPLVMGTPPPKELFLIDQRRVVALTINPGSLQKIRRNRLEKFGQDPSGDYARIEKIEEEIEWAMQLFHENRRWPLFDVTDRALEETASEITRLVSARMGLKDTSMF